MPPSTPARPPNDLPGPAERALWVSWLLAHGYPPEDVADFVTSDRTRLEILEVLIAYQRNTP